MPSKPMELSFPLRGVNEGWAYSKQPEGTSPVASNVVPIDPVGSRIRGGQRWGLSRYFAARHNGANALQNMTSIALSVEGNETSDTFTQANGVLSDTSWYPCTITYPNADLSATYPHVQTNKITLNNANTPGEIWACAFHKTAQINSGVFEVKADVTLAVDTAGSNHVGFIIRSLEPDFPTFWLGEFMRVALHFKEDGGTKYFKLDYSGVSVLNWVEATPGSEDWLDPAYWGEARELKIRIVGGLISFYVAGTLIESYQRGAVASYPGLYVGFLCYKNDKAGNTVTMDNWAFNNIASKSSRDYQIVTVSGGDVFSGRAVEGALKAATSGTNVLATSGRVDAQSAFGKIYFCDGVNANYSVWTASTNTVAAWTPDDGDALPVSGTQGARYITLYRGRIVLSGLIDDPHNWFMSAAGDPLNWDYGATPSATMAVAGNNTAAGYCPDIVTCLAAYSDDLMFIGGDHTLWLMRGDPADRGRIDNVSYQTGISGPDAYTFDPNGVFFWHGSGAIWRTTPGGTPESISRNRLDKTLSEIDLVNNTVHLAWDNVRHGLHIFVVPRESGSTAHYYWDQRTDGFWPISYPNDHGPTCVYAYDGDSPDDNALLLGGWDGYIRYPDSSANDDDGITINSSVTYTPISIGGPGRNTRINRLVALMDTSADNVVLTAYAEDTPQKAVESSTIRFTHTLTGGRTTILKRVAGNSIVLKLSNSVDETSWAMESLTAYAEVTGRTRKGQL